MLCNWHLLKSVTVCEHKPLPAAAWLSTEGRSSSKHRGHALCSPLCQDFATKDCYLSTKWEHSYSCCEDNWLAARLWKPSPSDRTVLWEAPPPTQPRKSCWGCNNRAAGPRRPLPHCIVWSRLEGEKVFVSSQGMPVCERVCVTVLGSFKCLSSRLCACDNLQGFSWPFSS